jgi:hypothetical protein
MVVTGGTVTIGMASGGRFAERFQQLLCLAFRAARFALRERRRARGGSTASHGGRGHPRCLGCRRAPIGVDRRPERA